MTWRISGKEVDHWCFRVFRVFSYVVFTLLVSGFLFLCFLAMLMKLGAVSTEDIVKSPAIPIIGGFLNFFMPGKFGIQSIVQILIGLSAMFFAFSLEGGVLTIDGTGSLPMRATIAVSVIFGIFLFSCGFVR